MCVCVYIVYVYIYIHNYIYVHTHTHTHTGGSRAFEDLLGGEQVVRDVLVRAVAVAGRKGQCLPPAHGEEWVFSSLQTRASSVNSDAVFFAGTAAAQFAQLGLAA